MDFPQLPFYPSPDPTSPPTSPQASGSTPGDASGNLGQTVMPVSVRNFRQREPPDNATVSITFQPSLRADDRLPDTAIISSNHVYFYVHRHRLLAASSNGFAGRFFDPQIGFGGFLPTIYVPESGDVLNVVLHTMYDRSCVHFYPSLETVEAALTALGKYGVAIDAYAAPGQPVFQLLTSHAPYRPIETYALAGQYGLEDVAVVVSGHLLPFDLSSLTDDIAIKMGPVYLKRLVLLHQSRLNHLRNIILEPPARHPPTAECGEVEQGKLTSAWAHASAQFVWDASPSISANSLRIYLERIGENTTCESCRLKLIERIQNVVVSWTAVKNYEGF
ncbi:hypothetical protein C8Q76DRAFT_764680 [Earliella scabrosa]|nr:hypothetical protein C8Q76DRAFT_764680 [Earliella scabrosa]